MIDRRQNGSRFYHFIDNMPDSLINLKIVSDNNGNVEDYIFLEANKSFERLIGFKIESLIGARISELSSNGKIAGIDLIKVCSEMNEQVESFKLEQYSEKLKKWYQISCYKSENDQLCLIFHDITESKNNLERISVLYESSLRFHDTKLNDIDYKWISDEILKLSGAAFVTVNIFDKEIMKTVTKGFTGLSDKVQHVIKLLGFDIVGNAWDIRDTDVKLMSSNKLVRMGPVHDLGTGRISPFVLKNVVKIIKLGDIYGIGITCNEEMLGSIVLIMREGEQVTNSDIVELFANQFGIMLLRKKAEEEVKKLDQEYSTVFNGSQDAMFLINVSQDNGFVYHMINKGYEAEVGIPSETVNGLSPRDIFGDKFGELIEDHYRDCVNAKAPLFYEESAFIDGRKKVWHTLLSPIMIEDRVVQIVGSSRNITNLKQWEDELAREKQLLKVTLHSIGDAVITTDIDTRIVILNKVAEALTGWTQEEAQGRLLDEVMTTVSVKKVDLLEHSISEGQLSGNQYADNRILVARDNSRKIISSSEAFIRDEYDNILGVVIVFRDVTLEKQKEAEVRYLGYHDKLTGLYNRAYFEDALESLDDEAYLPLGLIMGDSNGLKMVNDVFGHQEGDKLLIRIAEIFKSICGEEDIVARVGGDEFAVILPRTSPERANTIITSIKQMCNERTTDPISPSVAIGFAIKTDRNEDMNKVYKQAEDRMYNNKLVEGKSIRSSIISSLKKTLEERTHETEAHAQRLKEISVRIGSMMNLYDSELDELALLAILHDIGKIAIPDSILGKPGKLTEDEWKIMKGHCEIGYRIAVASPELAHIATMILSHHERWDGTGYPQGIKGEDIPLLARIVSVVDAFDAMTNDRPYHGAISKEEALAELKRCSGTQFDPKVVEKFIEVITDIE